MPTRSPAAPSRKIRFVLSDVAVARLREADRKLWELRSRIVDRTPVAFLCDVSAEAVAQVDKRNVENAPDEGEEDGR